MSLPITAGILSSSVEDEIEGFVAVANSGTNRVITSPDGITWTPRQAAEANSWSSVTYGNGTFVAVAASGTNRVMTGGSSWIPRQAAEQNSWTSVTYGNGTFVAVARDGTNRVMTSPNGTTWTARSAPQYAWSQITYAAGLFVAISPGTSINQGGTNQIMTSPDGITWTSRTLTNPPLSSPFAGSTTQYIWQTVTYGNGRFIAGGVQNYAATATSPDGITWTTHARSDGGWTGSQIVLDYAEPPGDRTRILSIRHVSFGDGVFLASGEAEVFSSEDNFRLLTPAVFRSTDGITWTYHPGSLTTTLFTSAHGNGVFAAVAKSGLGSSDENRIATSPDGITWTGRSSEASDWASIAYGEKP